MDKIVATVQQAISESDWKSLRTYLGKEDEFIRKNANVLDEALTILDPAANSMGYAYFLAAKLSAPKMDNQKFYTFARNFFITCNPQQVRLCLHKVALIVRRYVDIAIENAQYLPNIKLFRNLLKKLRLSSESLSVAHAPFLQFCLMAKCYSVAIPVLEDEIFEVNPDIASLSHRDVLGYFYFGALVYIGLKDYEKAFRFLKAAVSAPAMVMSQIMADAYKKYVLVSLIVHGKLIPLPKYTSSVMHRHSRGSFPHYQEIVNVFTNGSTDDLHKVAQGFSEQFYKEKNFGLIKQVIQALNRRNVQRLTQTYMTISVKDISTTLKSTVQDTEKQLLKMIANKEVFATINQATGMISFHENPEKYDNVKVLQSLDKQVQVAVDLGKKVKMLDNQIQESHQYLQRTTMASLGHGMQGKMGLGMGFPPMMGMGMGMGMMADYDGMGMPPQFGPGEGFGPRG